MIGVGVALFVLASQVEW
jgi:Siphovirus Gp157